MLDRILEHFRINALALNEVENSYSSTVYKCKLHDGMHVYLKIPYNKLKFERELEAYKILKGKIEIAEMLDSWPGDEECPGAFLLSELKGKPLTTQVAPSVAFQIGVLHASMHNIKPPVSTMSTSIKNEYPEWSTFLKTQFYSFAGDVKEILDKSLYDRSLERFEEMAKQLPSPDGPSLIHMDFRPGNIIVHGETVTGMIDFESVRFGSTEIDFTKLYRDFLCFDLAYYQNYQDGYKTVRPLIDLEAVLPFYQFTDAFNSIGWCKRRGIEENAPFLNENLMILKRFLG